MLNLFFNKLQKEVLTKGTQENQKNIVKYQKS